MRPLLLSLTAVLAAGCAVGPTYRRPEIELPARWKQAGDIEWAQARPRDDAPRGAWWRLFGDPALDALQLQASTMNYDLKAAAARVTEARAIARVSQAGWLPTIEANPAYDHFRRSLSSFGGTGRALLKDEYRIPFDLSYEVDLWGKIRRAFQSARAQVQASEANYDSALLSLTADVAQLYFGLRALDAEAVVLERTAALRAEALALMRQRAQDGLATALEVARARTELAAVLATVRDTQRRRAELENALAVLCGEPASSFRLASRPLDLPPPVVPPALPSQLLERRPDVAAAERAVAAANAEIGVAVAGYFPVIRLTGSAGWTNPKLESLITADSRVWSIGPTITVPVFAGGRNRAEVESARARHAEATALYRQRVLAAIQEAEDALANVRLRAEEAAAQDRVLDGALETAALSRRRYEEGLVSYLDVVEAERTRLEAELGAVRVLNARLGSTVLLIKALGGGWRLSEVAEIPPSEPSSL